MSLLLLLNGGAQVGPQQVISPGCYHLAQGLVTVYSAAQQRQDHYQAAIALATYYLAESEVC